MDGRLGGGIGWMDQWATGGGCLDVGIAEKRAGPIPGRKGGGQEDYQLNGCQLGLRTGHSTLNHAT